MSSRISLWGKALAGQPVNRENNRLPLRGLTRPKVEVRGPKQEVPPTPPAPQKGEAAGTGEEFRRPEVSDRTSVYSTPETWNHKFMKERPARAYTPSEFPPGRPRMKKEQRRRNTLSIAVSEEEEKLIRAAAADRACRCLTGHAVPSSATWAGSRPSATCVEQTGRRDRRR